MHSELIPMELHCPRCHHIERCHKPQMVARLQQVGVLRRTNEPEPVLIQELFAATAQRYSCGQCAHIGLNPRAGRDKDWDECQTN